MRYNAGMGVEIKSDKAAIWSKYDVSRHNGKKLPHRKNKKRAERPRVHPEPTTKEM